MEPAQKATERRVVRDEDQRLVGLRRRRIKENAAPRRLPLHDESNQGGGSKTYHHLASCGAICFIGASRTLIPIRSSSQSQTVLKSRFIGS